MYKVSNICSTNYHLHYHFYFSYHLSKQLALIILLNFTQKNLSVFLKAAKFRDYICSNVYNIDKIDKFLEKKQLSKLS